MERKIQSFKIRGMNKDLSYSSFNTEFSYDNKNIRLIARDSNTSMSVTNERGNKLLSLEDVTPHQDSYVEITSVNGVWDSSIEASLSFTSDYPLLIVEMGLCSSIDGIPVIGDPGTIKSGKQGPSQIEIISIDGGLTNGVVNYIRPYILIGQSYIYGNVLQIIPGISAEISITNSLDFNSQGGIIAVSNISSYSYSSYNVSIVDSNSGTLYYSGTVSNSIPSQYVFAGDYTISISSQDNKSILILNETVKSPPNIGDSLLYKSDQNIPSYNESMQYSFRVRTCIGGSFDEDGPHHYKDEIFPPGEMSNLSKREIAGMSTIAIKGVCWSTSSNTPTTADNYLTYSSYGVDYDLIDITFTNMPQLQDIYLRPFATNSDGMTSYGATFTSVALQDLRYPILSITDILVSRNTVSAIMTIASTGSSTLISQKGMIIGYNPQTLSINSNYALADLTTSPGMSVQHIFTDLPEQTTMYIKSYAINSDGFIGYSDASQFITGTIINNPIVLWYNYPNLGYVYDPQNMKLYIDFIVSGVDPYSVTDGYILARKTTQGVYDEIFTAQPYRIDGPSGYAIFRAQLWTDDNMNTIHGVYNGYIDVGNQSYNFLPYAATSESQDLVYADKWAVMDKDNINNTEYIQQPI